MDLINGIVLIFFIIGLIMLVIYFTLNSQNNNQPKIIYKYIPRTLKEQEESPVYVSEIFKTMFTQPSVWIDSINRDNISAMPKDNFDKYFISQF